MTDKPRKVQIEEYRNQNRLGTRELPLPPIQEVQLK